MSEKPRRWFRYSLRTFFVLLTVFAVWLGVQVKWIRDRHAALAWAEAHAAVGEEAYPAATRDAPWSLRLLGEDGVTMIVICSDDKEYSLEGLKRLFPEADIAQADCEKL